jgi:hypothetical protein
MVMTGGCSDSWFGQVEGFLMRVRISHRVFARMRHAILGKFDLIVMSAVFARITREAREDC